MDFVLKSFKKELTVGRLANIHYFEFTPSLDTASASHPFPELVYVERGRISINSENYSGELSEGELILHGSGERHSLSCGEGNAPNIIIIGFECSSPLIEKLTHSPLRLSDELIRMLAEIIKEARAVYLPPYDIPNTPEMKKRKRFAVGADQLIKNYLQILLIKAVRLRESADEHRERGAMAAHGVNLERTAEIRRYIDQNLRERISVEELCFLFNTNKTTLSKEFKSVYGRTVIDYANGLRIEETKRLLTEGELTLTEISEQFNMSSVHYLTALFKKYAGITPTEYLLSQRDDDES